MAEQLYLVWSAENKKKGANPKDQPPMLRKKRERGNCIYISLFGISGGELYS
jgi:hypothetical protein